LGDLGSAPLFLEKVLEKMRSRAETEMTFMRISKVSGMPRAFSTSFNGNCRAKLWKNFEYFQTRPRIMRAFDFWGSAGGQPALVGSLPTTR